MSALSLGANRDSWARRWLVGGGLSASFPEVFLDGLLDGPPAQRFYQWGVPTLLLSLFVSCTGKEPCRTWGQSDWFGVQQSEGKV